MQYIPDIKIIKVEQLRLNSKLTDSNKMQYQCLTGEFGTQPIEFDFPKAAFRYEVKLLIAVRRILT